MKTLVLLGLLTVGAILAPAATAHVVIFTDADLDGDCDRIELPGPHVTAWTDECGPAGHASGPLIP